MAEQPSEPPPGDALASVFHVTEIEREDERLLYFGEPLAPREIVIRNVWSTFRERGYEVTLSRRSGRHVLVAEPIDVGIDGVPWKNLALLLATVVSTFWAGTQQYYLPPGYLFTNPVDAVLTVWPFPLAVLGILAVHEGGHYVMSRHHRVDATLPYFIPMPNIIGTMGAVIRMKGQMPSRKALFDIGVAGPLAGLVATVFVTGVGLQLDPLPQQVAALENASGALIEFQDPLLLRLVAILTGTGDSLAMVHPVAFAGWVGMLVTFLNLLPVGQLDGGHILRSLVGRRQPTIAALVPGAAFAWAGYLYYVREVGFGATMWVVIGVLTLIAAYVGPATPVDDGELGIERKALGVFTFVLGVLCFMPVPFQLVTP